MNEQVLSNGTRIRVKVERRTVGTVYHEIATPFRKASKLFRISNTMFLMVGESLVPVSNPEYRDAATDEDGARVALAFFADAAESCIRHAAQHTIPVNACNTKAKRTGDA